MGDSLASHITNSWGLVPLRFMPMCFMYIVTKIQLFCLQHYKIEICLFAWI